MTYDSLINGVTYDGEKIFSNNHRYVAGRVKGTQCNYFSGDFTSSLARLCKTLDALKIKMANFKDEYGDAYKIVFDTVLLPRNRANLYDNFFVIAYFKPGLKIKILEDREAERDEFILMEEFLKELFYISPERSDALAWGNFRGFHTWRPFILAVDSKTPIEGTEFLEV